MPLVNAFRDWFPGYLAGTGNPFNNANSSIGVGDSTTNTTPLTYTDLQAATNKLRKAMDATYPTVATNVMTFRATFATTDANWTWNEWAIFNTTAASGGTMMSRKVEALGTKSAAQSWQITCTITFAIA